MSPSSATDSGPIGGGGQVIHGDLTENVLFDEQEPPAIIDLALYWRPAALATAIVVADAIVWEGATDELFHLGTRTEPDFGQLLARALIFRLVAAGLGGAEDRATMADRYRHAVGLAIADDRHRIDTASS